jgi:hypothetical protein
VLTVATFARSLIRLWAGVALVPPTEAAWLLLITAIGEGLASAGRTA